MREPLTTTDQQIILGRYAFDARYMGCGTVNMDRREAERLVGDLKNSTGVVGCVKHRINLAHSDGDAERLGFFDSAAKSVWDEWQPPRVY